MFLTTPDYTFGQSVILTKTAHSGNETRLKNAESARVSACLSGPTKARGRGNEWSGQGDMPTWLTSACNAGVSPEFFRIELGPTPRILLYPRQFELFG
jgi:hypothetical protein